MLVSLPKCVTASPWSSKTATLSPLLSRSLLATWKSLLQPPSLLHFEPCSGSLLWVCAPYRCSLHMTAVVGTLSRSKKPNQTHKTQHLSYNVCVSFVGAVAGSAQLVIAKTPTRVAQLYSTRTGRRCHYRCGMIISVPCAISV